MWTAAIGSGAATRRGVASGTTGRSAAGGRTSSGTPAAAMSTATTAATAVSVWLWAGFPCGSDDVGRSLVFLDDKANLSKTRAALFAMEVYFGEAVAAAGGVSVCRVNVAPM